MAINEETDLIATIKAQLATVPFGSRLEHMGAQSLFNTTTALSALDVGVGGRIVVDLPSRTDGRIEVDWRPSNRTTRKPKPTRH